ncbi:MAG TPA: hypothetical protein ENI61_00075 [Ignavibacteria bacterium]|nr:hypothetical protein [Ignavibacteria bacterium]
MMSNIQEAIEQIPDSIQKVIKENPDSIEIGTPSKGGALKIYGDFNKLDEFKKKIDNAMEIKAYANRDVAVNV